MSATRCLKSSVGFPGLLLPLLLVTLVRVVDMREQVQNIFINTPKDKQVMMFSATMDPTIRPVCRKFMNEVRVTPAPTSWKPR